VNAIIWEHPGVFVGGFLVGSMLGFLLQKGHLARFDTIIGQFLFKDFTLLRFLLSAIVAGGVSIYTLHALGVVSTIPAANATLFGSTLGGILLGIGMALLGYCPGSSMAALGQGSYDALFGAAGMIVGGIFYELIKPSIIGFLKTNTTLPPLPELLGVSPWLLLVGLVIAVLAIIRFLRRKNL
jgi:uncharacterized protein